MGSISGDVLFHLYDMNQKIADLLKSHHLNTSNDNHIIKQINDIKKCCSDLINTSTDVLNENNVSIGGQRSDETLEVLTERQEVPQVLVSPEELEDIKYDIKVQDMSDKQELDLLSQREDNITPEVIDLDIESEDSNESHINNDIQPKDETIDGIVDEYKGMNDRHVLNTNEDNNHINGNQRDIQLETNEDIESEYKPSDEEVSDESGIDYRQRVKRVKKLNDKYVCDFIECHKVFSNSKTFSNHKSIHMNRTYKCHINGCDQTFKTPDYLLNHKYRKHSTKYQCNRKGCHFKTGHKSTFDRHMKCHSNKRQFNCLINNCDKNFKLNYQLTEHHLRVHPIYFPDIPWIECTYNGCHYKTKYNTDFNRHIKRHSK